MCKFREEVIEIIQNSCACNFDSEASKLIMIQTLNLFFDKHGFDEYYANEHISKDEFNKYFKPIVKRYDPSFAKKVKKEYKEKKHES